MLGQSNPLGQLEDGDALHALRPLTQGWISKITLANKARKEWLEVSEECTKFYSARTGFMWDSAYKHKFWEGKAQSLRPTFQMTLAKAFEAVALFGPMMYNRNPIRTVNPRTMLKLPPELFMPQFPNPPMNMQEQFMQQQQMQQAQMQFQMMEQQQMMRDSQDKIRASMMEGWLNYTPNEQPYGGLKNAAEAAITDALVKGRGCLWSELYQRPGSQLFLTGSFYDTPENLFVDPDADKWDDVQWIARKCVHPHWMVEEEYGLPKDSLKNKASLLSAISMGDSNGNEDKDAKKREGSTSDLVVYYKIWSRMGIGARLSGINQEFKDVLERTFGDYCYLVVAPGVPYPLNLPTEVLHNDNVSDDELKQRVQWPVPFWRDNRWPVSVLDFYRRPRSTLPLAPLEPGLGELKFLNVMISHMCNRIWSSSRDFIAVLRSASKELKMQIKDGDDLCILELDEINKSINETVQFLQQPQVNLDTWKIIDAVMQLFDKRVGLTDLIYGQNPGGTQPRSAEEVNQKRSALQIRPDYMASKVEEWMTEASRLEGMTTRWFIRPEDITQLMGQPGAMLWQNFVMSQDVDLVVGEMEYRVESGTARKKDRDSEVANASQSMQLLSSNLFQYASATGNVGPYNNLLGYWAKANDVDPDGFLLSPPPPPPAPVQQQQPPEQQAPQA
jgi:hypothetical protein